MSSITLSPIATRFAWKEYRSLRGLWLSVLALGLLVQCGLMLLAAPGADVPSITFGAALGSAVLYAVGAAAIMFAAEHEDETYGFLAGLPTGWLPMFLAKLATAIFSALVIAAVLALTGWFVAGGRWPSASNCSLLLGLFGIAIIESIAWGTLFSLCFKRPLVAVLWTLVVGSVAMHWAVNASSSSVAASSDLRAYSQAIPLRLTIVAAVLVCAAAVARRWLTASSKATATTLVSNATSLVPRFTAAVARIGRPLPFAATQSRATSAPQSSRRAALARLLWQTWRSSWKMLLLPFVVALFLYVGIVGIGGFIVGPEFAGVVTVAFAFLLPTLYGAMAFGADQRGACYRFFAEHAARPRYVWISRHLIWLGSLLVLSLVLVVIATIVTVVGLEYKTGEHVRDEYWLYSQSTSSITRELHQTLGFVISGSLLAWLGALTAYSIGQLCSMLLRSEILAAFLGIVLSTVLSAWIAAILLWNLNPWLFLLPLFGGLMVATWLRAPDWITGRNSWRSWWKPALAVVLPILILGMMLPEMRRLPQAPRIAFTQPFRSNPNHYENGDTPAARETASMYEQAGQILVTGPEQKFVDRWHRREFVADDDGLDNGGIDETKMSAAQREEYRQDFREQEQIHQENLQRAVKLVIEASRRPSCRFDIDWSGMPTPTEYDQFYQSRDESWIEVQPNFYNVLALPLNVPFAELTSAEAVEFQLATLRLLDHLRQGQPTSVAYRVLGVERGFLGRVVEWAADPAVPTADLLELLTQFQQYFREEPIDPAAPFFADDRIVRNVLLGKTPPMILADEKVDYFMYLAFLANELSWERERALVALDQITRQNQNEAVRLADFIHRGRDSAFSHQYLQRWLSNRYSASEMEAVWSGQQSGAATSFLTRLEYDARVPVRQWFQQVLEMETRRRAAVLQLALLLYRRDDGKFPEQLSDLVPKYLDKLPNDPFTGGMQPFSYAPTGVDLPVKRYSSWGVDEIAPLTPLVWSVGPANVRLKKREYVSWTSDESDLSNGPVEHKQSYYVLEGDQDAWERYTIRPLVFPLPKLPPKSPSLPPP